MTPTDTPHDTPKPSRQGQGGGPKTSFGKEASSKNATTHGLSARYRLKNHFQEGVHERMTQYVPRYQPQDDDDWFLCDQAAIGYTQHREAMSEAYFYLAVRAQRAILYWDLDRTINAGLLADQLSKRPTRIAPRLASTLHGARWLLEQWEHLREFLESTDNLFNEQVSMAYDLLGIDVEGRKTDPKRLTHGSKQDRMAVVDAEMDRLRALTEGEYLEHDRFLQRQAITGEGFLDDPAYRRFLRYGRQGQLLNARCLKELERRRIARDLPAYAPDGTMLSPVDPPGTPPRPAPGPLPPERVVRYEPAPVSRFHLHDQTLEQSQAASRPESASARPQPERRPEPRPLGPIVRPRPSPEEARQKANDARLKQEAEREARRRDKTRAKADRKAAKAARNRNR